MGDIKVGTASWTDKTLLAAGWYPADATDSEKRLSFYATRFPLVEVDATYYSPPSEATARLWAQRTPDGFVFNIKAYSMLTGHPTRVASIYKDIRPETDKVNIYPKDMPNQDYEEVWTRFLSALDPLVTAGKLGAVLFQFPPWFTIRRSNKNYLIEVRDRMKPLRPIFEFRHKSWFDGSNADETIEFMRQNRLPYVAVDMPQGHNSSIPPVLEATADLAAMRFHGHSLKWTSKNIYEKFGYLYSERELRDWVPKLRRMAAEADQTHVLMNNCYSDYAQRNGQTLVDLLGEGGAEEEGPS